MKHDYFNPATYQVIDRVTGEEVDVAIFVEKARSGGWQKAYAKTLAEYIQCGDGQAVAFLAYILKKKDSKNYIHGTQREFAEKCKVSLSIINRTMKSLEKKGLLKKVRNGCYMLSPEVIRNGSDKMGAIMFRVWKDC